MSADVRNWVKLSLLLDCATSSFRKLFAKIWVKRYGREWNESDKTVILKHKQFKRMQKIQRGMVDSGNIDKWDISLLRDVLTASNLLNLPTEETMRIDQIRSIRNEVAHHATKLVSDFDFSKKWDEISAILVHFGESNATLDELKSGSRVGGLEFTPGNDDIDDESVARAAYLKAAGTAAFAEGNYLEAIQIFTEGIVLPKLPATDQAILYWNRCEVRLKLCIEKTTDSPFLNFPNIELEGAKQDAKNAIKFWPDWWRGYFSLGKVYQEMKKLKKAQDIFTDAIAKEPQKQSIKDAIEEVRVKLGLDGTLPIDLKNVAKSRADFVHDLGRIEISKDEEILKEVENVCQSCECAELDNFKDCLKGIESQLGLDGSPCDYRLATQYYRKAADRNYPQGKLFLGLMILNGEGIKKDVALGVKLLKEAAAQAAYIEGLPNPGVAEAEFVLGLCHEDGVGFPVDFIKAKELYQLSSDHGCSKASNNLGLMYEYGIGLQDKTPNVVEAEQLYESAVESGLMPDSNAMLNLARLCEQRDEVEVALGWCHRAKVQGNKLPLLKKLMHRLHKKLHNVSDMDDGPKVTPEIGSNAEDIDGDNCNCSNDVKLQVTNLAAHSKFQKFKMEDCLQTSSYGKMLREAKQHALQAATVMSYEISCIANPPLEAFQRFVEHFSKGAQIELRVFEFSLAQHQQATSIIKELLTQKTSFEKDVRVCYVALNYLKPFCADVMKFLNECIKKYYRNSFFLRHRAHLNIKQQSFEDAMRDINKAMEIDSKNVTNMFDQSELMRLARSVVKPQAAIVAYKQFLEQAPNDHPSVPDAFYSIALLGFCNLKASAATVDVKMLTKCWLESKRNYDRGVSAEANQLSLFLPYKSSIKAVATRALAMSVGLVSVSLSAPGGSDRQSQPQPSVSRDQTTKLKDCHRTVQIKQYREWIRDTRAKVASADDKFTFASELLGDLVKPILLIGLKAITFRDMDASEDSLYEKRTLAATIIDEVGFTSTSLFLLLEDEDGFAEVCLLNNWLLNASTAVVRKVFVPGRKLSVINPILRITTSGQRVIFVNDSNAFFQQSLLSNMCRYCYQGDAAKKCTRCKASYCNETCQKLDWKVLKHKMICR